MRHVHLMFDFADHAGKRFDVGRVLRLRHDDARKAGPDDRFHIVEIIGKLALVGAHENPRAAIAQAVDGLGHYAPCLDLEMIGYAVFKVQHDHIGAECRDLLDPGALVPRNIQH